MTMIWFLVLALIHPRPGTADRQAQCHNDPHCTSFDGQAIEYQGTCDVVLLEEPSGPYWLGTKLRIIGRLYSCTTIQRVRSTCVEEIEAVVSGKRYSLVLDNKKIPQFQVDGGHHPISCPNVDTVFHGFAFRMCRGGVADSTMILVIQDPKNKGEYIELHLKKQAFSVIVSTELEPRLRGRIRGLFGNMNNNPGDDGLQYGHVIGGLCDTMLYPWLTQQRYQGCGLCKTGRDEAGGNDQCYLINEIKGPFKKCYQKNIQREQMYRNCVNDVCVDRKCKCTSLEAYARSCSILGVCNGEWREKTQCKLQCPKGMEYHTRLYHEENPTCLHGHIKKCLARNEPKGKFSSRRWRPKMKVRYARYKGGRRFSNEEVCALINIYKTMSKGRQLCSDGCACPFPRIWDPSVGNCVRIKNCKD